MPLVNLRIEKNDINFSYQFSEEKINYLMKFIEAIAEDDEITEMSLMEEIEAGLRDVRKIRDGELPKKTITQMIDVE
jgi:hypothetical protein